MDSETANPATRNIRASAFELTAAIIDVPSEVFVCPVSRIIDC
jgi:hypothetical protein